MIVYSYVIVSAALAVTQGSTTPPSIGEASLPGHSNSSLLYTLLRVAGFSETCVSGVLDFCSSAQEEAHYPSLIQELQENKAQLQDVKDELQEGKVKAQEVKEMVQQELQEMKEVLQEGRVKLQEGKVQLQDVKEELQEVKTEAQEEKQMLQRAMLMLKIMFRPRHCKDLLDSEDNVSGLREIFPNPELPHHLVTVYCDQETDDGGWTIFQRRVNNSVRQDFFRSWREYQAGFGDLNGEFWLGLDHLHDLASTERELRIDLFDYEGQHRWAKYGTFQVGPEDTNYRLTVGRYSGDAGDSMTSFHNGQEFSTHDADHDKYSRNCAEAHRGDWWYNRCGPANLNGYRYVGENSTYAKSIFWDDWQAASYSLMQTSMMIRPAH